MNVEDLTAEDIPLPREFKNLPVFAVGGWVRDALLPHEQPNDVDLMVAEVSPAEMRERGFKEIDSANNDTFGVFLDSLGREVAIARQETSTGSGHKDFNVEPVAPDVIAREAVERDLSRRDFTINAMALDVRHDVLHDPHGGAGALEEGVIRHVSDAFRDDPLRILRGARFAARLDFDIAEETQIVMEEFAHKLEDLPGERIRMELEKTFKEAEHPRIFFDMLAATDSLQHAFPELAELRDVPAGPRKGHEERDALHHTMLVLEEMMDLRPNDELAGLMAIAHDFGKAETPKEEWPHHHDHGEAGAPIAEEMAERLSCSTEQRRAMVEACRFHMRFHRLDEMRASTVIDLQERVRNPELLRDLTFADRRGRIPKGDDPEGFERLPIARFVCDEWTGQRLIDEGHSPDEMGGEEFGNLLHQKRVEMMRELEDREV